MDFVTNNPYILRKNEYPHVKGLSYKIDKYDQSKNIKIVMGHLLAYLSHYRRAFKDKDKTQITALYNQIMSGKHPCVSPELLIQSGLDSSEYVTNLKSLVTKINNSSAEDFEKWEESPLFKTMNYLCSSSHWENWQKLPNARLTGSTKFSVALLCEVDQSDEICIFDLFSMLKDALNGTANQTSCLKAGSIFLEHLKSLPSFRENYRLVPPTNGDNGNER